MREVSTVRLKNFGVLDRWSLKGGGRLLEVPTVRL